MTSPAPPAGVRDQVALESDPILEDLLAQVDDQTIAVAIRGVRDLGQCWMAVPPVGTLRLSWALAPDFFAGMRGAPRSIQDQGRRGTERPVRPRQPAELPSTDASGPATPMATSMQTTVYNIGIAAGSLAGGLILQRADVLVLPVSHRKKAMSWADQPQGFIRRIRLIVEDGETFWLGSGYAVVRTFGGVMIRVLLAEDMRILRDTLVSVLNLEDDIKVVAQVAVGTDIVPAALAERPDLAVLDIDLPGADGLTAAAELHERLPACRVVILTVLGRPGQLRAALDAHVAGFMVKDAPSDQLIDVLRKVAAGERVIDPKLALAALEMKQSPLSERETDVLRRFAAGADLPAIAAELFLSYGTVRNYMASAVTKLGGRNRMDAVRIATEAGWL